MNWIKKMLGYKEDTPITKEDVNKDEFTIEHYPISGRFYPKVNEDYMKLNNMTGIYETLGEFHFHWADYGNDIFEAKGIIEMFKEQKLKENIKTIKVD